MSNEGKETCVGKDVEDVESDNYQEEEDEEVIENNAGSSENSGLSRRAQNRIRALICNIGRGSEWKNGKKEKRNGKH
ncbi:unnamed protein product [Caenorhabditis auriculariae]|uniref:Uncharacterized protein n=1 Tax=Caenorhabditis auriculariae TaxID=2777116 RepID=A0A8S1HT19_9PELO|nr:unnamed protein product [Caenorhabditis auriculariae]